MQVSYIDHMGSDLTVVNAARVSFDNEHKELHGDRDVKLIHYLANNGHWTPFGHCQLTIRVKAPIFVARQLVKHQVGLVWNEVSRRYVSSRPEIWWPDEFRGKPVDGAKQGSHGTFDQVLVINRMREATTELIGVYAEAIESGMAPEQARMILPQNMMTEWYWTGSLMAFARVCKLRLHPHAQEETRIIARQISDIAADRFPISWDALNVYEIVEHRND